MPTLIALLGHSDSPTDGVQDYCEFLGRALERRGVTVTIAHVEWANKGWFRALRDLWNSSGAWRGNWVVVQYTALAWSLHGFPFGLVAVVSILRCRRVRCGVVFHEPHHSGGAGVVGRMRASCQSWVIRRVYGLATKAVFPDPLETIRWLPKRDSKASFIPIGASVPERLSQTISPQRKGNAKTVAVFCITGAPHAFTEIEDIAQAARCAVAGSPSLRFIFFGRGTPEAREQIAQAFRDIPVDVSVLGLLDANRISEVLADADVMLCVRGAIYPRRGSAIAGIACGLPIVCYRGPETGFPITEAGLELVPYRDRHALGNAVGRVLSDDSLRHTLGMRSARAQTEYFSWERIAERFVTELFDE